MPIPILGLPKFPTQIDPYEYVYTEEIDQDVFVSPFQSGIAVRTARTSHTRRRFSLNFRFLTSSTMQVLDKFYTDLQGPLVPFIFEPAIEKLEFRTLLTLTGSQTLATFPDGSLRITNQTHVARFTEDLSRTLHTPFLESTELILTETLGENNKGKFLRLNGIDFNQYATVPDHTQQLLNLGTDDFMFDFLYCADTEFISNTASYGSLDTKTLLFNIASTTHAVSFDAAATNAFTVAKQINDQQGFYVDAQVFSADQIKIKSVFGSKFFTMSGTAKVQLNLNAPDVFPIWKHDNVDTGYYFKQAGVSDFTFFMESGGTAKTITAATSFDLNDGIKHYVVMLADEDGNGQLYIDGEVSGAAIALGSIGSVTNSVDFTLNNSANGTFGVDRLGIWTWTTGLLPTDISSRIADNNNNRYRVDSADGLKVLWGFDGATGIDKKAFNELVFFNDPAFFNVVKKG